MVVSTSPGRAAARRERGPGARHGGMCDEVLEPIDSARCRWPSPSASATASSSRAEGQVREALPYDLQRPILAHLYAKIPAGAGWRGPRFSGEGVARRRYGAAQPGLAGKPAAGDEGDDDAETPAPLKPTRAPPDKDQGGGADPKASGGGNMVVGKGWC